VIEVGDVGRRLARLIAEIDPLARRLVDEKLHFCTTFVTDTLQFRD
jgi:hypothetical protein